MAVEDGPIKRVWKKTYGVFGFTKGYNFVLFFIFAGALMGFTLARFSFLDVNGQLCADGGMAPGECYYFHDETLYRIGITIHLASVLPGSFLACFQFVPKIRHKVLMYHRIAGYVVILLMLVSNISGMIISRRAFGGGLDIQSGSGAIGVLATVGLILGYYNIKRLQIDQHRAWMLRSFFYMASIITNRLILMIVSTIISASGEYYSAWPCGKIDYVIGQNRTLNLYPACEAYYNQSILDQHAVIRARMTDGPVGVAATLGLSFGVSTWVSFLVHAVGVELYLRLTPAESERLRAISHERQLEGGYKRIGDAELTAQRLGNVEPSNKSAVRSSSESK